jgi:hypothetical protein
VTNTATDLVYNGEGTKKRTALLRAAPNLKVSNIPAFLRFLGGRVSHRPVRDSLGCLEQEPSTRRHDVFRRKANLILTRAECQSAIPPRPEGRGFSRKI